MNTGERLHKIMNDRGITAYKLAREIGISQSSIGNYINNKTKPDASKLDLICKYLEVSKNWLLSGSEEENDVVNHITSFQKNVRRWLAPLISSVLTTQPQAKGWSSPATTPPAIIRPRWKPPSEAVCKRHAFLTAKSRELP